MAAMTLVIRAHDRYNRGTAVVRSARTVAASNAIDMDQGMDPKRSQQTAGRVPDTSWRWQSTGWRG
jgi:hypothetical protein